MSDQPRPFYLANEPVSQRDGFEVLDKHTGEPMAVVSTATREHIDRAIGLAVEAQRQFAHWPAHRRRAALKHVVNRLRERREEFARTLVAEAGKPIRFCRGEVDRAVDTFILGVEESTRLEGRWQPLDISPRGEGAEAIWKRVPNGPCSFITPFNFPLNLAAHKIAPALACGCAFVLKPDPRTPVTTLMLAEILAETDLPAGTFSILTCLEDGRELFTEDDRLKLLSFTGSASVGWKLKAKAGKKKVALELGGNAACIVDASADLDHAADRITHGAFYQAGQSCISVQRVLIHREAYEPLKEKLVELAQRLRAGDPYDDATFIGPMIDEPTAQRIESWVSEALDRGARALIGAERDGPTYQPTLLENVPRDARASCQEVFGPVALLEPFDEFDEALRIANDSEFGLQAGVFTESLDRAFRAFNELEVGGVIINNVPSTRVDSMPYGGVKSSGLGREGVRFAIEDMTEIRLMLLNRAGRD